MKRILIIEDDPITTKIYRHTFECEGFDVSTASDGDEGIRLLHETKPDVVQLDLMLPKTNGVEIIRHIRAQPQFRSLPIIVLSNTYRSDLIKSAWKAGANKCVAKLNCPPPLMLSLIKEVLAQSEAAAKHQSQSPEPEPAGDQVERPNPQAEFVKRVPMVQANLRSHLHGLAKSSDPAVQVPLLKQLHLAVTSLAAQAAAAGFVRIAHMASALEVLLKDLSTKPKYITSSTLRTVAQAFDCLEVLFGQAASHQKEPFHSVLVLAVDDEPICRETLWMALNKANLRAISLDDPELALRVLNQNRFDLIFLDVEMPVLSGFELCSALRKGAQNKGTPVIFVTSLTDFDSRARSSLSGGNDLIAKPFLVAELAAKALTFILRAQAAASRPETSATELG